MLLAGPAFPASVSAQPQPLPTPSGDRIELLSNYGITVHFMRVPFRDGGQDLVLGFSVTCAAGGLLTVEAYFGPFPPGRPVQLAVRGPDGAISRFGSPVIGGRASGFHDPILEDAREQRRFLEAALQPGALVSNGFRSFFNRASVSDNRGLLAAASECLAGGTDFIPGGGQPSDGSQSAPGPVPR